MRYCGIPDVRNLREHRLVEGCRKISGFCRGGWKIGSGREGLTGEKFGLMDAFTIWIVAMISQVYICQNLSDGALTLCVV